jgi:hypothetical protein
VTETPAIESMCDDLVDPDVTAAWWNNHHLECNINMEWRNHLVGMQPRTWLANANIELKSSRRIEIKGVINRRNWLEQSQVIKIKSRTWSANANWLEQNQGLDWQTRTLKQNQLAGMWSRAWLAKPTGWNEIKQSKQKRRTWLANATGWNKIKDMISKTNWLEQNQVVGMKSRTWSANATSWNEIKGMINKHQQWNEIKQSKQSQGHD